MSILAKLRDYLDSNQIKYTTIVHSQAYTSQELAQVMHVPGREMAKSVVIKIDGKPALAVLPSTHQIDFDSLKLALGTKRVELVKEQEFESYFPGCELGAMPALGLIFGLPVYLAHELSDDQDIVFNAGTHTEAIRMSYSDFEWLTQPVVCDFAVKRGTAARAAVKGMF